MAASRSASTFVGGAPPPFRIATWVLVLAEPEEIAITTILPEWRTKVPSILHARRPLRSEERQQIR
jgi:hypothetical protein